jgi:hypothetical protein
MSMSRFCSGRAPACRTSRAPGSGLQIVKLLANVVIAVWLLTPGCGKDLVAPSGPTEAFNPNLRIYVAGYVVDSEHQCIAGAVVDILDSSDRSLTGRKAQQPACDFENGLGYDFGAVPAGTEVRLRASAMGYQPQQRDIVISAHSSTVFTLTPE